MPGQYNTKVALGVGTSQEGEAMTLLLYVHQLASQEGVFWVVVDPECAIGALHTCQESRHYGDGIPPVCANPKG